MIDLTIDGDSEAEKDLDEDVGCEVDVFEDNGDLNEDVGCEADVFEDNGCKSVPEDVEGMKMYVSSYRKRAGELIDMADEVLDKGLEDNREDCGFMELKELIDQLFVARKYSKKPEDNEDPTDDAYEKYFTPEKGVNQKDIGEADENKSIDEGG